MALKATLVLLGLVALGQSQVFQLTKPKPIQRFNPYNFASISSANTGRYQGGNDGRYSGGNDGRYNGGDDGKYHPDDSGAYVHSDSKYQHLDGAQGSGSKYVHQDGPGDKYKHQEDRYKDKDGRYGGGNDGNDGRYKGGSDGQYKHQDNKYQHQDNKYQHAAGPSGGSGPGPEKYRHQGDDIVGYRETTDGAGKILTIFGTGNNKRSFSVLHKCKEVRPEGYHYLYDAKEEINGEEDGTLQYEGTDKEAMCVVGYYSYVGPDNKDYTVYYIADEYGFRPIGDHLHPAITNLLKNVENTVA